MPVALVKRRFTVDEYYRMAEAGILGAGERVELINGEIIEMAAIGSRHAGCVSRLDRLLNRRVGDDGLVRVQSPVRLSDLSEPEPDVVLVRPRSDDYTESHPGPADVLLVVEVADSSAGFDRGEKAPLYALAGINDYWIVDLSADQIEVYRDPTPGGYRNVSKFRRGDDLSLETFPDLAVPVISILPPTPPPPR